MFRLAVTLVAMAAGTLLPYLAARDHRLLDDDSEQASGSVDEEPNEEDAELKRIQSMVREWKAEAQREGKPLKLPMSTSCMRSALRWQ